MLRDAKIGHGTGAVNRPRSRLADALRKPPEPFRSRRPELWKCEECARLGITKSTLARAHFASYLVVAKPRTDHFRCGETRPIARPVRIAVAPRCAVQEVDPRFSRLAALTLVNWMAASHPGMEAGAPEAKPQTLQFRRRLKEEERGSESPTPGNQRVGRPAFLSGTAGRSVMPSPARRYRSACTTAICAAPPEPQQQGCTPARAGHTFEPCQATTKLPPARSPPCVPGS
jgi:hypothetical protein